MRSNNFETQELKEINRKGAGELRGFPILWIGIIGEGSLMAVKKFKYQERLEM